MEASVCVCVGVDVWMCMDVWMGVCGWVCVDVYEDVDVYVDVYENVWMCVGIHVWDVCGCVCYVVGSVGGGWVFVILYAPMTGPSFGFR